MAPEPGNPLYRVPAGLVLGVVIALVIGLAVIVAVAGSAGGGDGGEGGDVAAVTEQAPATTSTDPAMEQCLVQNPARPVRAAYSGPEAYVACSQFAIQAPHYGGAGWTVARDTPPPAPGGGRHVVCELGSPHIGHVTIQDAGAAREGLAECRRLQRDGWEQEPLP
jgi:hypothetical protein